MYDVQVEVASFNAGGNMTGEWRDVTTDRKHAVLALMEQSHHVSEVRVEYASGGYVIYRRKAE